MSTAQHLSATMPTETHLENTRAHNAAATRPKKRLANWDLLRSLAMFLVVVVHSSGYLGPIAGFETAGAISEFALICDPIFFTLSGYFAIRPLRTSLGTYYFKKVISILLPCMVYSILLYLLGLPPSARQGDISLSGFISFQYDILTTSWWFVPALLPYLAIAPFLYFMFSNLKDEHVLLIARFVAVLTVWGAASLFCVDLFGTLNMPLKATVINLLTNIIPTQPIPGAGYFIYFCLGYFVRRLSTLLDGTRLRQLIAIGLVAWVVDIVLFALGFKKGDPSYYWLFAVTGAFIVFDRLRITSPGMGKLLAWTANRSFAIYLTQFTTIILVSQRIYDEQLLGNVTSMHAGARMGIWLLVVVISYLLALGVVSIVDSTLVRGVQYVARTCVEAILRKAH